MRGTYSNNIAPKDDPSRLFRYKKWLLWLEIMAQKKIEVWIPVKYFWKNLEMSLFNCEINLISTWSENFIDDQVPAFAITDTKFYVPENVNY